MVTTNANIPYDYQNDTLIDENLKCAICLLPFQSPINNIKCDHTFCQTCITTWLQNKSSCPCCRAFVSKTSLEPVKTRIILNQLDCLLVRCKLCFASAIQRGDFDKHMKTCPKQIINCIAIDIGCPWTGPRDQQSRHIQQCSIENIRPSIQKLQGQNQQIQEKMDFLETIMCILEKENKEKQKQIDLLQKQISELQEKNQQMQGTINKMCRRIEELTDSSINKKISLIFSIFNNALQTDYIQRKPCIYCGMYTETRLNIGHSNTPVCRNCLGVAENTNNSEFYRSESMRLPQRSSKFVRSSDEETISSRLQRFSSRWTLCDFNPR